MATNIIDRTTNTDVLEDKNVSTTTGFDNKTVYVPGILDIGFRIPENESIIKVIGVGGGGNNAVLNMFNQGIEGVDYVICNTDYSVLRESPIPIKIQLGKKLTEGLGAGCNPQTGREAAEEEINEIREVLQQNTKMVFIVSGLGGGTGTGATPIIAKEAKSMGILTVAIVTLPYKREGIKKYEIARKGLNELKPHVDSLIVITNDKICSIYPKMNIFEAWKKTDEVVATAAKSIAEVILRKGYMNIDFADVKRFMQNSGMALMGIGKSSGENRALEAVKEALSSPLLNDNDIKGSKNVLVNISCSKDNALDTTELDALMEYIRDASGGDDADGKYGVIEDESLGEAVSVTIIATGFPSNIIDENTVVIKKEQQQPENNTVKPEKDYSKNNDRENNCDAYTENKERTQIQDVSTVSSKITDIKDMEAIPAYVRLQEKQNGNGGAFDIDNLIDGEAFNKLKNSNGVYSLKKDNSFVGKNVD